MDDIIHIPLAAIHMDALPRDRSILDPDALLELRASIASDGLRQPIEVWRLSTQTEQGHAFGLISGLRRLTAHHALHALRPAAWQTIAAFLRSPANIRAAMAAMIAENEIRADLTPWDKGRILVQAVNEGIFASVEQAADQLHPNLDRQKRFKLRSLATVVTELDQQFSTPENLSQRQMLHLSSALRGGLVPLIRQILKEVRGQSLDSQWAALVPTLHEASLGVEDMPATPHKTARPRRLLELRQGLMIRRELGKNGWSLHFSGDQARKGALMDDVMDHVERTFQRYE